MEDFASLGHQRCSGPRKEFLAVELFQLLQVDEFATQDRLHQLDRGIPAGFQLLGLHLLEILEHWAFQEQILLRLSQFHEFFDVVQGARPDFGIRVIRELADTVIEGGLLVGRHRIPDDDRLGRFQPIEHRLDGGLGRLGNARLEDRLGRSRRVAHSIAVGTAHDSAKSEHHTTGCQFDLPIHSAAAPRP